MFGSTGIAFSSFDLGFCLDLGSKFLMEELVMLPKNLFSLIIAGDFMVFKRKRERSEYVVRDKEEEETGSGFLKC